MPSVGVLIVFAVLGAWMCVKARAAGPAAVFAALALVLFVATPVGSRLPEVVASVVSSVDDSTTPVLTREAGVSR